MKKLASLIMALVMCMSLATVALASGSTVTIDKVTLSDVVRTEEKTVAFKYYGYDPNTYESFPYTKQENITIYYLAEGTTVTIGDDSDPLLEYFEITEDGAYFPAGSDPTDPSWTVDEYFTQFDLIWIRFYGTGKDVYFAVDKGQTPTQPTAPVFSDVSADDWFAEPVSWAIDKGITTGMTNTTFAPTDTCTQEQIITFLYRAKGTPAVSIDSPYTDVTAGAWYYDAVRWGYANGLRQTAAFGVSSPCSRSDVVFYLWTLAGKPAPTAAETFTDVPADAVYAQAVAWAVEQGITNGMGDGSFAPDMTCTRAQIVTFLHRALAD